MHFVVLIQFGSANYSNPAVDSYSFIHSFIHSFIFAQNDKYNKTVGNAM